MKNEKSEKNEAKSVSGKKHMFKGLHPNTILFQGKNTFLEAKKYENVQIWEVLRD